MSAGSGPPGLNILRRLIRREDSAPLDQQTLLQRAARCYAQAGLDDDALRVYQALSDHRNEALICERLEQWRAAAEAWALVSEWSRAAACYLQAQSFGDAAEALIKAGDGRHAAWILADRLQQPIRAERLISEAQPTDAWGQLEVDAVLARCAAATNPSAAAKRLRAIIPRFRENRAFGAWTGRRCLEWSIAVAAVIGRGDLAAALESLRSEAAAADQAGHG